MTPLIQHHHIPSLLTTPSERKIDRLDDRLASIEASLRGLLSGTPTPDSTRKASFWSGCGGVDSPDSPDSSGCDSESSSRSRSGTAFEGDSALSAHTTRAGQLFEETLHKQAAAADEQTPEMTAAFTSLRSLLTAQSQPLTRHDLRFPGQKDRPRGCPMDCEMPPAPVVLAMLKAGKGEAGLSEIGRWLSLSGDYRKPSLLLCQVSGSSLLRVR